MDNHNTFVLNTEDTFNKLQEASEKKAETLFRYRKLEKSEKIECIRYLEYGKRIKMVVTEIQNVEIDTPEDLENVILKMSNDKLISKYIK